MLVLAVHVLLGGLYALNTPLWQVPDEPAHYNYVAHVATQGRLPELSIGDYDAAYLNELKSARFPRRLPTDDVAYESHQPPLYYMLAAPIYHLARNASLDGRVHSLRLFSVALSTAACYAAYRALRLGFRSHPAIVVGAVGVLATLPMHTAISSGVNNDPLAELVINTVAWVSLASIDRAWTPRRALAIGALLGLAILTKMQSYVAFALVAAVLGMQVLRDVIRPRRALVLLVVSGGVALLIASPWLVRNVHVYGLGDPLALQRHDMVVQGQLTTREFVSTHGLAALLSRFVSTTYKSFWGQFGWMATPLSPREYWLLGVYSCLCVYGALGRYARTRRVARSVRHALIGHGEGVVMVVWVIVTGLGYLWWNVRFVQHQARYLFPALPVLSLILAIGWDHVHRRALWEGMLACAITAVGIGAVAALSSTVPLSTAGLTMAMGGIVLLAHALDRRWAGAGQLLPMLGLALLSLTSLYHVIVPWLSP